MVKRITASLLLVLVGAISILAQIDYNKQIKNAPAVSQGNMNGVRVVDGLKFAQSAAGINAADADLGTAFGEIWIPSTALAGMTATDAQISISKNHTLRLMGRLNIDSVNKGPILLATGSKIICNDTDTSPIINVGVGTSPSLIRLAVQDGSVTSGLFVEGCLISAGTQPVTNGVIDASGSANLAYIRNNYLFGFTSGWGIFVQDIQSGALAGTNNLNIQGNNITASNPGSGGCIDITHSATNSVGINSISIIDNTCIPGPSLAVGAPIVVQNTSAGTHVSTINLLNLSIFPLPASQEGVYINGGFHVTGKQIFCNNGTSCVYIANNTNNLAINFDNVVCVGCTNVLQDIANNYINSNNYINHYGFKSSTAGYSGDNVLSGVTTSGNFNNIRIVDGVRFAKSAAGINAADADLGDPFNTGEIWIPPTQVTATDAQISISAGHKLRVFGTLIIDAVNKGPILLGAAASITCSPAPDNASNIQQTASGAMPSMVRLATQDGSQTAGMIIEGCDFFANASTVSNGVIDATGSQNRGWIRDSRIRGFTSGTGIFIQDIQSGALGGTNSVQILNNQIIGTTTGSCITITHGSTNAVTINGIDITNLNCTPGATSGNSITLINSDPTASHLRQIYLSNILLIGTPVGASSISIGGVQQAALKGISCTSGSSCVTITSSTLNGAITLDNILNSGASNTLLDQSSAAVTITTSAIDHYDFPINNTGQVSYLNNVSYLKVNGLAPASATGTGFGTGPTFALDAGSTNNAGTVTVTAGTTPSSSGTLTLNFNTTQTNFGVNPPTCAWTISNGGTGAWNPRASIFSNVLSTTSASTNWDDNSVNLTAASTYKFNYWCSAK